MSKPRIIYSNSLSNSILFFGGITFALIGVYLLLNIGDGGTKSDGEKVISYLFSSFFIILGVCSLFNVLDNLYIIINIKSIKIKSLFRQREILRKEIIGYGIKHVEGEYFSNKKIRILTSNKTFTIDSSKFETTYHILNALKNKNKLKGLFKVENLIHSIYFYITTSIGLIVGLIVIVYLLFIFISVVLHL